MTEPTEIPLPMSKLRTPRWGWIYQVLRPIDWLRADDVITADTKVIHANKYRASAFVLMTGSETVPETLELVTAAIAKAKRNLAVGLRREGAVVDDSDGPPEIRIEVGIQVKVWPVVPGVTVPED